MKTFLWVIVVLIILGGAGFGIWGYAKAQDAKKQAKELEQITAGTMDLKKIDSNAVEISLSEWKNLSDKAPSMATELASITLVPESLKNEVGDFYSAKAQDKYKEAQYLQVLLEAKRRLGLDAKAGAEKSKGQIETVLKELDNLQNEVNQKNLSLGPEYDTQMKKLEQEVTTFKTSTSDLASKMNFDSPSVQLNSAGLDRAIDELKMAVSKSLNDYVELQDKIKNEISGLATGNWVNPLSS